MGRRCIQHRRLYVIKSVREMISARDILGDLEIFLYKGIDFLL
ncbi:hypothetical protein HMPREF1040_1577 [Megasphaera sp. UPII 135-E]|nr:hypothetical protein HMPREF1040_1577 [Megasphaera sp. UPII 135-E]